MGKYTLGGIVGGIAIAGLTGLGVAAGIKGEQKAQARKEEFNRFKAENYNYGQISKAIDDATINNSALNADDRVHAKRLLEKLHSSLQSDWDYGPFNKHKDELMLMIGEFANPDPEAAAAHVRYYWSEHEAEAQRRAEARERAKAEQARRDELYYEQRKLDTIAETVTKSIEAITSTNDGKGGKTSE